MRRHPWRGLLCLLLLALLVPALPARAQAPAGDPLRDVGFDQKLNAQAPLDLAFRDETGRSVQLGDYFGAKPVILTLGYYECPMLCGLVFRETADSLRAIDEMTIGDEFEVVSVSIDPGETPEIAAGKKTLHVQQYGRDGAAAGWHFLTGTQPAIDALTQAVGFRYVYDLEIDQYAHPAGIIILTPQGRVSRYIFGIDFPPKDVRLGLVEASDGQVGTAVDHLLLLCYQYDPATGQYTPLITNMMRLVGVATVLILGGALLFLLWQERHKPALPEGKAS